MVHRSFYTILLFVFYLSSIGTAAAKSTSDLELRIAYGQGRLGGIYEYCASSTERGIIGGSLTNWKVETFRGYHGRVRERTRLVAAFDQAAHDIAVDKGACTDWKKKAMAVFSNIHDLSEYGRVDIMTDQNPKTY